MKMVHWKKFALHACSWVLAAGLAAGSVDPVFAAAASEMAANETVNGLDEQPDTVTDTEAQPSPGDSEKPSPGSSEKPSDDKKPSAGSQTHKFPKGPASWKGKLYVNGKLYSGYYKGKNNKIYRVKKGERTLYTGTLKAGKKYYQYGIKRQKTLARKKLYVNGRAYNGFYLGKNNKLYRSKNGSRLLYSGTLKAGKKYYTYGLKKQKKCTGQTLYVKGKPYNGYYLGKNKKMYLVKKGSLTRYTGTLAAGKKYYTFGMKKQETLTRQTIYLNGAAEEGMSGMSLANLQAALKIVQEITDDDMTKQQKLKACFDFVRTYKESRPRTPHYLGDDWPVIYANDMFERGTGNCCSYAAAFAYLAKAIGYEEVYCCNSGGHGWAEIDGLIYDPEWSLHNHKYNYYALSYNTKTDQGYKGAIGAKKSWMHVKL